MLKTEDQPEDDYVLTPKKLRSMNPDLLPWHTECARWRNMTRIELPRCNLVHLPEEVYLLEHVTVLRLPFNKLTFVGKEVKFAQVLRVLDVSNNKLVDLPEWIGEARVLQEFNVGHNLIGDDFEALPKPGQNMRKFFARNCGMDTFPKEVFRFKDLMYLDVSNSVQTGRNFELVEPNVISVLPPEVGSSKLLWLRELDLRNLELTDLPDGIGALGHLKKLFLGGNSLTFIPRCLLELSSLELLDLSSNCLTYLPLRIAGSWSELRELYLSRNRLSFLPDDLNEMKHLDVLEIGGNHWHREEVNKLDYLVNGLRSKRAYLANFFCRKTNCKRCRSKECERTTNDNLYSKEVDWQPLGQDWFSIVVPDDQSQKVAYGHLKVPSDHSDDTSDDSDDFSPKNDFGLAEPRPGLINYDFDNLHNYGLNLGPYCTIPSEYRPKRTTDKHERYNQLLAKDYKMVEHWGKTPGRRTRELKIIVYEGQFDDAPDGI